MTNINIVFHPRPSDTGRPAVRARVADKSKVSFADTVARILDGEGAALIGGGEKPEGRHAKNSPLVLDVYIPDVKKYVQSLKQKDTGTLQYLAGSKKTSQIDLIKLIIADKFGASATQYVD